MLLASVGASLEPKKFDCATCIMQYGKSERMIKKSERNRQTKGCFDLKTKSYRLENIRYNNCVGNHVTDVGYLMEAFVMYEKGHLPFQGTIGEQPNKIMEIFDLIYRRRADYLKRNEK